MEKNQVSMAMREVGNIMDELRTDGFEDDTTSCQLVVRAMQSYAQQAKSALDHRNFKKLLSEIEPLLAQYAPSFDMDEQEVIFENLRIINECPEPCSFEGRMECIDALRDIWNAVGRELVRKIGEERQRENFLIQEWKKAARKRVARKRIEVFKE